MTSLDGLQIDYLGGTSTLGGAMQQTIRVRQRPDFTGWTGQQIANWLNSGGGTTYTISPQSGESMDQAILRVLNANQSDTVTNDPTAGNVLQTVTRAGLPNQVYDTRNTGPSAPAGTMTNPDLYSSNPSTVAAAVNNVFVPTSGTASTGGSAASSTQTLFPVSKPLANISNLGPGSTGQDVKTLQDWLVQQGYMTQAQVNTGYGTYGPQTTAAVAAWQKANGIDTQGNPGYFGPISKSFVSQAGVAGANTNTQGISGGTGTGSSSTSIMGIDISGLPPDQQALLRQLQGYLDKLSANGQTINPNITITPDQAARFMTQAKNEIDPYYQSQLKIATDQFQKSLGYSTDQILNNEQIAMRDYGTNFRNLANSLADQGFAQSGAAQQQENYLAQDTQTAIDNARKAFTNSAYNSASQFAQQYGNQNVPVPSITGAPRVIPGTPGFTTDNTSNPVYSLSPNVYAGLTGSQQYQENTDIQNRASQLTSAFLTQQGVNAQRTLNA